MATGYVVLLVLAAAIVLLRVVALFVGGAKDETTYGEPALKLDDEVEQPHEVFGELASTLEADHDAAGRYLRRGDSGDAHLAKRWLYSTTPQTAPIQGLWPAVRSRCSQA